MAECIGIGELKTKKFWAALLAELIGTLFLVLAACGSALPNDSNTVQIALGFGFSVATMVWTIAHVSGGHINPAVSVGFLVTRKISILRFIFYVIMQCVGAIIGAALLDGLIPDSKTLGTSQLNETYKISTGQGFGIELLITFVLVFTVFSAVDGGRRDVGGSIPFTIGVSIAMCHLWAVPFTGAGMNPARVFGPALISETWDDHWIYWVGPLIGGAAAALIYDLVFAVNATPSKAAGIFKPSYDESNYDKSGNKTHNDVTEMKA